MVGKKKAKFFKRISGLVIFMRYPIVLLILVVLVCQVFPMLLGHAQVTADMKISVTFSLKPQWTSIFGFRTTLSPQDFQINVSNLGASEFPGGNLTVCVIPPSEKYWMLFNESIPKLMPHTSHVIQRSFKPREAGIYTIKVFYLDTPTRRIMPSDIEGGFLVEDFSSSENTYAVVFGFFGVLAGLGYYVYKRKKGS